MLCCGIGVMAIAATVMCRKRWRAAVPRASLAGTAAAMAASITLSVLGAQHLGHYVERARANERSLLAEIMAQPICTGNRARLPARIALAEPVSNQ